MKHSFGLIVLIIALQERIGALPTDNAEAPREAEECEYSSDCPKFHWCSVTLYSSECASHLEDGRDYCGKEENGVIAPDHEICRVKESEQSGQDRGSDQYPSVTRCIAEIGYKCANAHYMPCPESGCPVGFECMTVGFKDTEGDACVPLFNDYQSDDCESNIDCGYSDLINYWETCDPNNKCNYIEQ